MGMCLYNEKKALKVKLYATCFIAFVCMQSQNAMAIGEKYSEQGHVLYASIKKELIDSGKCNDDNSCKAVFDAYGEHGNRVNINIYSASDREVLSIIYGYTVAHGIKITNGVPITIKTFTESKEHHSGVKALFSSYKPSIIMEVNK